MAKALPLGKIHSDFLAGLLKQIPRIDDSVILGPQVGCDAAGLKLQGEYWSVTTDPITFAPDKQAAQYSVAVNINDVACLGCRPKYFLSSILLPKGYTDVALQTLWQSLIHTLRTYRIQAVGGHTEVTRAVNTPVIIGQMIGKLEAPAFFDAHNAKPGDRVLLWNPIAIEGTALLASACRERLAEHIIDEQLNTMEGLLERFGLCVLPAAEKLFNADGVVSLHDPTEGGLATALHELADVAQCGLEIDEQAIPVLSETRQLSDCLGFDPLGLIASGCLLIVCREDKVADIQALFQGELLVEIGVLTESSKRSLIKGKTRRALPRFDQDEIARFI
ncbi:MAG: hydrogenase expression protein [Gammaproteobacteria bacterium CG11_big_fil_rev_8_21_14_0_20_46_22]|nr:MAG: hydrogenase expression protein [Gammaproteobacteria bacterium CG12_big_fil_rev_8_21_14_0_65_46_12]PIR10826.1 MAG: hydrogenase expression protein [Gammaproteobacteria bacterium CG11_big_fil_rev_8_21_14_0_20_46_22]